MPEANPLEPASREILLEVANGITLRPLRAEDAEAYAALIEDSRAELGRWMPWANHTHTPDEVRTFIAKVDERRAQVGGETTFAILVEGSAAGIVDMHEPSPSHDMASIGYWLGTRFTGRGIMTRSVERFVRFVFEAHPIHRLELYSAVDNVRSRRVAERAGFAFEGILRERLKFDDRYLDAALYARFAPRAASE